MEKNERNEQQIPFDVSESSIEAIAASRTLIAELDQQSSLFVGKPSTLVEETANLLTCDECREQVGGYIEAKAGGQDFVGQFPRIHDHLFHCASCSEYADMLYELIVAETTMPAPVSATFADWYQSQQPAPTLWEQSGDRLHRLAAEIPIVLERVRASFGELPSALTPQLVPAVSYRSQPSSELETVELLELPHPEANLVVKVRMGAVADGVGAIVLEIGTLEPATAVADAKVTLRDDEGGLLEGAASDEDGSVIFQELEPGKYQFHIQYADQEWFFVVRLIAPDSGLLSDMQSSGESL